MISTRNKEENILSFISSNAFKNDIPGKAADISLEIVDVKKETDILKELSSSRPLETELNILSNPNIPIEEAKERVALMHESRSKDMEFTKEAADIHEKMVETKIKHFFSVVWELSKYAVIISVGFILCKIGFKNNWYNKTDDM